MNIVIPRRRRLAAAYLIVGNDTWVEHTLGYWGVVEKDNTDTALEDVFNSEPNGHTVYAIHKILHEGKRKPVRLHQRIMKAGWYYNDSSGLMVDHIDGFGLNNRRSNLRMIPHGGPNGNQANRHGFFRGQPPMPPELIDYIKSLQRFTA